MRRSPTMAELRAELTGDSVSRRTALAKLIALVRADEREKVLNTMARARERAGEEQR